METTVELLTAHHDRAAFSSGEPSLDAYLHRQAGQDMRRDLAVCYILCVPGSAEIIGYYTLSATSIDAASLPPELRKKLGRYRVLPAALLGRLAVNTRFQRQGMGEILLLNAMRRVLRTGIGAMALVVDALHESAAAFYQRFGFQRFVDDPLRLYLPTGTIRDLFPGEDAEAS